MLTKTFPFLDARNITPDFAARLQMLADDCAKLAHDDAFVTDRLTTAPVLDLYVPLVTPIGLHLVGQVTGHPRLGSRTIVTSQLWFADPGGMWVRTLSRFYALGRPGDDHDRILTSAMMTFDERDDDDGWPENGD
ncbi:MAG: hypothetical protein BGP05_14505 [Rhizobiales bacterium 62-47]|nr:hypothetical protein [Hyphomicrobiales bacterium]OJY11545.1 MAG: hypothetical protein BGP05_14505 [Rhizobiales bacterium 62-47]